MGTLVRKTYPLSKVSVVGTSTASNTNNSATFPVSLPAGWQPGDYAVLFTSSYNMSMPSAPTGWSLVRNDSSGARQRLHVATKKLVEPWVENATFNVTLTGTLDSIAAVVVLLRDAAGTQSTNSGGSTTAATAHPIPMNNQGTISEKFFDRAIQLAAVTTYVTQPATSNYTWPAGKTEILDYVASRPSDTTQAVISVAAYPFTSLNNPAFNATSAVSRYYSSWTAMFQPK